MRGVEMTREEAIKELEILREDYWDNDGYGNETEQYDDTMTALDMAIQALERERNGFNFSCNLWCTFIIKCYTICCWYYTEEISRKT